MRQKISTALAFIIFILVILFSLVFAWAFSAG